MDLPFEVAIEHHVADDQRAAFVAAVARTGKPLVVTEPTSPAAYRPASRLLDELPLLPVPDAGSALALLRERGLGGAGTEDVLLRDLAAYYFGETADGASTRRFEAAVADAWATASV